MDLPNYRIRSSTLKSIGLLQNKRCHRYDPGHDLSLPPATDEEPSPRDEGTAAIVIDDTSQTPIVRRSGSELEREHEHPIEGTLRPSPEPQPSPIDRWARGWVAARSANVRLWVSTWLPATPSLYRFMLKLRYSRSQVRLFAPKNGNAAVHEQGDWL